MPDSNETKSSRRRFSPHQKAQTVRLHLLEDRAISDLCDEQQIQPSQYYQWQTQLFKGAEAAFATNGASNDKKRIQDLEAKLAEKDSVIAELLETHLRLKKRLGVNS